MNNYKIILSYDGLRYNGFQKQKNTQNTIQAILESAIGEYLGEKIEIIGSGRTDAGVSAVSQIANFKTTKELDNGFILKINEKIPKDIAIKHINKEDIRFHSRLNAKGKTYQYTLWRAEYNNVFLKGRAFRVDPSIDVAKMKKATRLLIGSHDFIGFSSLKNPKKSTIRNIASIEIKEDIEGIKIIITGDGFLYNMVRIIVGTLIEIGEGKRELDSINKVLSLKDRGYAGFTAPPYGLSLIMVYY